METENLTALDDNTQTVNERIIPSAAFFPPALADSQYKQLELLQHLSLYSELLIYVSGEAGMGKTFIANALLAGREAPDQSLMFSADFSLTYVEILHKLAEFLDLAELADDIESIENQVLSRCLQLADEDQGSLLIIIDQADQLSDEVLEEVNHLALLATNALHVMIIAKPELEQKLIELPEPQAPIHVMEIEPLDEQEAEVLLLQSFPEKEWMAEDVDYILQQGVGNPGKILYVAQQLLAGVKPSGQAKSIIKFPITHIAAMLLIASALVMSYFYQSSAPINLQPTTELQAKYDIKSEPLKPNDLILNAVSEVEKTSMEEGISISEQVITEENTVPESEVLVEDEVDFNFLEVDAVADAGVESVEVSKAESQYSLSNKVSKPVTKSYTSDERVLVEASDTSFVIQLFASYSMKNARAFVAQYKSMPTELQVYQTSYKSKPWFVVVSGPYSSKQVAANQAKKLPSTLRQQNPWVRSIKPIQLLLRDAH